MQYTTNYSLKKPQYADEADIEVINDNTDDVDTLIHQNRTMIAPAFDNTKAYVTGDPVEYLGALYVFTTDKAAGAWDASKVEPTTAAEMGGGGASALADLDDVEITNPSTGQALLFDDDDDVWKNQNLPDVSVTKEASGNPIEITDAAAAPLVKCVTEIQGSQDLHGYDKPWVEGAGKNKLPMTVDGIKSNNTRGTWSGNTYTMNGVTITILTDSAENVIGIKVHGLANDTVDFIPMDNYFTLPANSYILNGCSNGSSSTYRLNLYKVVSVGNELITQSLNGDSPAFTLSGDENLHSHMYISQGVQVDTVVYPMIRLSTVTDSTFAPYSNICPITAYTEGEIEVSDGDGNTTTHTTTYPSAIYRGSEDVVNGEVVTEWGMIASYAGETLLGEWISDRDEYAPGTTPTTGAQVAYALATPTTSSVTPTNLPIRTLSGYNHIESSTGEMEIEYITKTYEPLVELIEASDHIYSTQEQIVGTWIDGKTLYEQTLYLASASISSGTSASMPSISGVETVMVVGGSCYDVNDQRYYPLPYIRFNDTESIKIQAHVVSGSLVTLVFTNFSTAYSLKDISVVIRYTKASSNNRSLSKGGGEQETKQEVKEEPTEEPKEENNEAER